MFTSRNSNTRNSKLNTLVAAVLSVATIGAALAVSTSSASAWTRHHHHRGHNWGGYAAGGLALGLLGGLAVNEAYGYRRVCTSQRQYDEDGNYIGRARVCRRAYVD